MRVTPQSPYLSIVVPVYNEEKRIAAFLNDVIAYMRDAAFEAPRLEFGQELLDPIPGTGGRGGVEGEEKHAHVRRLPRGGFGRRRRLGTA